MDWKYQHGFNGQRDKLSRNNYVGASLPLFMAIKPILSEMAMICGMVLLCVVCPPCHRSPDRGAAWRPGTCVTANTQCGAGELNLATCPSVAPCNVIQLMLSRHTHNMMSRVVSTTP